MSEDQCTVDLLEQLRVALDDVQPLLAGRIVDIEMARLRVLTDRVLFRAGDGQTLRCGRELPRLGLTPEASSFGEKVSTASSGWKWPYTSSVTLAFA